MSKYVKAISTYAAESSPCTAVLRLLRHSERDERLLGRGRHKLLKRYLREARSRRRRAFQAWLAFVGEKTDGMRGAA